MKIKVGPRTATITLPACEVEALLRDALRGAEWFNGAAKGNALEEAIATSDRCKRYEDGFRKLSEAEDRRILDLQDRGI